MIFGYIYGLFFMNPEILTLGNKRVTTVARCKVNLPERPMITFGIAIQRPGGPKTKVVAMCIGLEN